MAELGSSMFCLVPYSAYQARKHSQGMPNAWDRWPEASDSTVSWTVPDKTHFLMVLDCIKPKQNRMELLTKYVAAVARLLGLGLRETKPLSRSTSHSSTVIAYWGRRWWPMKGPFYSSPQPPPEVARQIQAGIPSRINLTKVWPFLEQTDFVGVLEESTAEPKSKTKKVRNAIAQWKESFSKHLWFAVVIVFLAEWAGTG